MEWLFILALGVWVWLQSRRIGNLTRRLDDLATAAKPRAEPAPVVSLFPERTVEPQPELEPEPDELLLDTPIILDAPANDDDVALAPRRETRVPTPAQPQRSLVDWIAENGFVWLGAGLAVIAGAALLSYAAQQGFFGPGMRLGAAVLLGAGLIGASEWVRRFKVFEHPLAAAELAGAGAAVLYASAWAAHGLMNYVGFGWAAVLLAACSLLLLALSMLHRQPLGVMAIVGAMLAPLLTSLGAWPAAAVTLYVCSVGVAGFAVAAFRRWAFVAGATIAGLYVWFAAAIALGEVLRALALLSFAAIGGAATGLKAFGPDEESDELWDSAHAYLPSLAICTSSVFTVWTWLALADAETPMLGAPILGALMFAGLAAGAVRKRLAHPVAFAVATGAAVLGATIFIVVRGRLAPLGDDLYVWALVTAVALGLLALAAKPNRHGRVLIAGAGAVGAALMALIAVFSRDPWASPVVWPPLFVAAGLLGVAAHLAAREVAHPDKDWSVGFWVAAGAALALVAMESLSPLVLRPAAQAATALGLAGLFAWRGWRAAGFASVAAAALALAHALSEDAMGPALTGAIPLWRTLAILGAAASFLFTAAHHARRRWGDIGEALSSAAILVALLAGFHALRWVAAGGAGAALDPFTESALQALILIAAGYIVLPRGKAGFIAKARGHLLIGIGLAYALLYAGLSANPWWGAIPAGVLGPAIFNAQLLGFAAPAALAIAAAARLYPNNRVAARIYAVAGAALGLMWLALEIRRAFHRPMSVGEIGLFEGHCYALAALAVALVAAIISRMRDARDATRPLTHDLHVATRWLAIGGIAIAGLILLLLRHPWWGAQDGLATSDISTSFAVLAQAIAIGLALALGRALSSSTEVERLRFIAASAATLFAWSFGHAAIRWLHHRELMDDGVALTGLEGFGHALWPLALVLGASWITLRAPGRDTVRAYLYDLEAIWAAAVWPALAWAALGLWWIFNPWWGVTGAEAASPIAALIGLATLLIAAALSAIAPRLPHIRYRQWFEPAARISCVGHLFVALSLTIRRLYQGPDMRAALEAGSLETWTYSALWALFGAGVLAFGASRKDSALRWAGVAVLIFVTAKVLVFDMGELAGVIRAASALVVGALLVAAALFSRRFRTRADEPPAR